jgi:hypothetical protein
MNGMNGRLNLWDTIVEILTMFLGGETIALRRIAAMQHQQPDPQRPLLPQYGERYIQALLRLALWFVLISAGMLVLSVLTGIGWLVALIGCFLAAWTFIAISVEAPLGMVLEYILSGGKKGSGERWIKLVKTIMTVELLFALGASIGQLHQNPELVPYILLLAAVLGVLSAGTKSNGGKTVIKTIVLIVFLILSTAMFFPNLLPVMNSWRGWANNELLTLRKPGIPPGGLTTNQAALNAAVAEAQAQAQAQAGSPTPSSQPTPPGMQGYAVQAEQPADIHFAEGEDTKEVEVPNGNFTPWIFLPTTTRGGGSYTTTITPPLGPGQAIIVYCLDGRVFTRTAEHNPVIAPGPQAFSLMGRGWAGVATIRVLRITQNSATGPAQPAAQPERPKQKPKASAEKKVPDGTFSDGVVNN